MKLDFQKKSAGQSGADVAPVPYDSAPHFGLGRHGEALALEYIKRAGYRIVAANFSIPIGRNTRDVTVNAEIDLIAYEGPILCFVEVKTRASEGFAPPQVNVDLRKQRQIARAARGYRRMLGLMGSPYRYDVVTVILPASEELIRDEPRIELLKNYWTDEKLRKRNWYDSRWD
jgi:putative endonuclease